MLHEVNQAQKFLIEKYGNSLSVPEGAHAIPLNTSKGPLFMKVVISFSGRMSDFSLYKDEALTIKLED